MEFRTKTDIAPLCDPLGYEHRGVSVGSCFADNISRKLKDAKFRITSNPFGVLYNPASAAGCIGRLAEGRPFTKKELAGNGGLWCSLSAHGSFSSPDAGKTLDSLNKALTEGAEALKGAGYIIITWGTSWIYELAPDFTAENAEGGVFSCRDWERRAVANCHKFPQTAFTRRRMSADEIVSEYRALFKGVLSGKRVILTVSPVRHLKDGLHGNNLSKAVLLLAAEKLTAEFPNVHYFPSFEIVNDELRDYRFYDTDMAHPSQTAVDYIWECFRKNILSPEAQKAIPEMEKITAAANHRPFNTGTDPHKEFLRSAYEKAVSLQSRYPGADLRADILYFSGELQKAGK